MNKKTDIQYKPSIHNPIIIAVLESGSPLINVAAALGITTKRLAKWRIESPELNKLIESTEQRVIADLINQYKESLQNPDIEANGRAVKLLQTMHNYYINHTYVHIPELISSKDMHSRHDIIMHYCSNGLISLEQAEIISKLLKENADIYKMDALEKRMIAIEEALKYVINKEEL